MTDEIAFLPATELISLYRDKKLSPVEVHDRSSAPARKPTRARSTPLCSTTRRRALAQARASEARWREGEPHGLLDGVPVAIKDTLLTAAGRGSSARARSIRTRPGTRTPRSRRGCAPQVRCSSAKRRPPNLAGRASPTRRSPASPATRGISSARPAAAAAAVPRRCWPGSARWRSAPMPAARSASRPRSAAFSGLKPTFGRVAAYPPSAFGDVAHVGPMARTVADAALMLDAIKGPDSRDWYSLPDDGIAYRDRVRRRLAQGQAHRVVADPRLCRAGAGGARRGRARGRGVSPTRRRGRGRPTRSRSRRCRSSRRWRSAGSGRCCARRRRRKCGDGPGPCRDVPRAARR